MPSFKFEGSNSNKYKTLLTQELLRCGFLGGTSFYASVSHSNDVLEAYYDALVPVFQKIRRCEEGMDLSVNLNSPEAHLGFQRLN